MTESDSPLPPPALLCDLSTDIKDIHPEIAPLGFLVGVWVGQGTGEYPTIDPFAYGEESTFSHEGKPYLVYIQRTWDLETGAPMHSETGYWRLKGPDPRHVEMAISHSSGIVEIAEGALHGSRIEVASTTIAYTSTAKPVTALGRSIALEADILSYRLRMSASGLPAHHHLSAELMKKD